MPNLDYDPKNPCDLLDRPVAVGDIVAWGTTYGRSPAVCVAQIEDIVFQRQEVGGRYNEWEKCAQHEAEKYTLRLLPLKSTGSTTIPTRYHQNGYNDPYTGQLVLTPTGHVQHFEPLSDKPKVKTVHLVRNIVKLEPLS